jgi:hypothetical protein
MLHEIDRAAFIGCLPVRERPKDVKSDYKVFSDMSDLGNFSVVVIQTKSGLFAGVSKRNPTDKPSETGVCVAAVRAWRSFQDKDPGYNRQRPVSKKEAKYASIRDILVSKYEKQNDF